MKIGYFTDVEGWGGSEMYLLVMMKSVRAVGHMPVLFGVEGTRLIREAREANIQCVVVKQHPSKGRDGGGERHRKRWLSSVRKALPHWVKFIVGNGWELIKLCREFRGASVDVMHVNLDGFSMAGLACSICGIPTYGRQCLMPQRETLTVRRWFVYWTNKYYTLLGGPSKACVAAWRRWCGLPASICRPVWNGIDLNKFDMQERRTRTPDAPFRVLFVGRLHPMKGVNILIAAFGMLNDARARLIIVGEGADEVELKQLAGKQANSEAITFAGHSEQVGKFYSECDCLVLPSVSHESFGFVLAEAMACGLPLITSDYGPFPEINKHEETGLIVAAGDAQALALAIRRLMNDPPLCVRMGHSGRQHAQACFTQERMVSEMLEIYAELAPCGRRSGSQ